MCLMITHGFGEVNVSNQQVDAFNHGVELGKQHEILRNKKEVLDMEIEEQENHIVALKQKSSNIGKQLDVMMKELDFQRSELSGENHDLIKDSLTSNS